MKARFLFLIMFLSVTYSGFSQKIKTNNNVTLIESPKKDIKLSHRFEYKLQKYVSTDGTFQFFICCNFQFNTYHNFPNNAKMILKTFEGETIELTAALSMIAPVPPFETSWEPTAFYPVTQAQLEKLFKGVSYINVETLSYNYKEEKAYLDFQEEVFKKDEIGKHLNKMFMKIENKK